MTYTSIHIYIYIYVRVCNICIYVTYIYNSSQKVLRRICGDDESEEKLRRNVRELTKGDLVKGGLAITNNDNT